MKIQKIISQSGLALLFITLVVSFTYANSDTARFNGWQVVGPTGGDIRSIAIDPKNKSRLYISTLDSQVYTSADAGKTWNFLVSFNRPQLTLDNIQVDLEDSRRIYVTGHRHKEPGGFFYSEDGGATWKEAKDLRNEAIHAFTQSSKNPRMLVAGAVGKVFVSYDSGESWQQPKSTSNPYTNLIIDSLAVDPRNADVFYVGTSYRAYKTTDGGKNWRLISKGMIDDSDVFAIDIDPTNPDHIVSSACSGIYESFDGGELWKKIQGIPSQSRRTRAILRNPSRNGGIYAGTTEGFWMSADNGKKWALTTQRELEVNGIAIHPDEPNKVYIATNNYGLMVSNDGGRNFNIQNGNFTSRFMHDVVPDIERPNRYYATTNNTATGGGFIFISEDGGQTWTTATKNLSVIRISPFALIQDKQTPDTIYIGTNIGIFRSLDRGRSWTQIKAAATPKKAPVKKGKGKATAKAAPATAAKKLVALTEKVNKLYYTNDGKNGMYAATNKGLYRTYNVNEGWEKLPFGAGIDEQVFVVHTIAEQPQTIWAGTARSGVVVSKDGGITWKKLEGIQDGIPVSSIEVDKQNLNRVYVGTTQTFYVSRDGGDTFIRRGGGLPLGNYTSILISPSNSNEVFVGSSLETRGGVYQSLDAGQTWKQLDTKDINIPSRRVWAMTFDPKNPNRILLGTQSSGIFRIERGATEAVVDSGSRPRVANNGN